MPGTRPATHAKHGPARSGARHSGPGRPFRWLARRPLAASLLAAGLLAVSAGAVSPSLISRVRTPMAGMLR